MEKKPSLQYKLIYKHYLTCTFKIKTFPSIQAFQWKICDLLPALGFLGGLYNFCNYIFFNVSLDDM